MPSTTAATAGRARLATPDDMEAIHRLNYRTFVEEIPQHPPNAERRLVDRFHDENLYVVYEVDGEVVGMVCGRAQRPFSLDQKLGPIDTWLPPHTRAVEIRLLAVDPAYRATRVLARLLQTLIAHFVGQGFDLGVLSGTTRQLALYGHMGCVPFAHRIGTPGAEYQPMYLELETVAARASLWPDTASLTSRVARPTGGRFLPGPVAMYDAVRRAFAEPPTSHRATDFLAQHARVRAALCARTHARHGSLLLGSGTLANDVVGAQLAQLPGRGVVLANGEFGQRLVDHARRLGLRHTVVSAPWGEPMDWDGVELAMREAQATWLWAVHSETSTGVVNDLDALRRIASAHDARLALDAISSLGALPLSLAGVWMASAVSGKAIGAYPGIAIVLHEDTPAPHANIPRYLDLGYAVASGGVPFTQSSNLLAALDAALTAKDWSATYTERVRWSAWLRQSLSAAGLTVLAPAAVASPVVHTIALPPEVDAQCVGDALRGQGWDIAFESEYLRARNWVQICLMGAISGGQVRGVVRALVTALR
ncbi:MAG: GNAT family N-acetyltransferase [Gemmatimonadaceae bacterium]|nr:GNAT family N-acetyltransferase [Gemmatimonadaceae bacterium]